MPQHLGSTLRALERTLQSTKVRVRQHYVELFMVAADLATSQAVQLIDRSVAQSISTTAAA